MHSPTNETDSILAEAARLVAVDRDADYGDPVVNHERIAALWSAYLGVTIGAREASIMAALVKLSREANKSKRDNLVDAAAYLEIASRCRREDEERITLIGCREQTYGVTPSDPSSNGAAKPGTADICKAAAKDAEVRCRKVFGMEAETVKGAAGDCGGNCSVADEAATQLAEQREAWRITLSKLRSIIGAKPSETTEGAARRMLSELNGLRIDVEQGRNLHAQIRSILRAQPHESTVDAINLVVERLARLCKEQQHEESFIAELREITGAKELERTDEAVKRFAREHAAMSATLKAHEAALSHPIAVGITRKFNTPAQRTESVAGGCAEGAGETASNKTPAPPSLGLVFAAAHRWVQARANDNFASPSDLRKAADKAGDLRISLKAMRISVDHARAIADLVDCVDACRVEMFPGMKATYQTESND